MLMQLDPQYLDQMADRALLNPTLGDDLGFNDTLRQEQVYANIHPRNRMNPKTYQQTLEALFSMLYPRNLKDDFSNYRGYQREIESGELEVERLRTLRNLYETHTPPPGKYDRLNYQFKTPSRHY